RADAGQDQRVIRRIVVRESAGFSRDVREIQLFANPEVDGELRADLPFVLKVAEERRIANGGVIGRHVAQGAGGLIEQESGEGVSKACLVVAVAGRWPVVECP